MSIGSKLKRELRKFIDENFTGSIQDSISYSSRSRFLGSGIAAGAIFIPELVKKQMSDINEILESKKPTFSETLLQFIDKQGLKDSEVYNKAGISRQLFSKIRIHPNYKPTKATVLLFALAMKLNLEDTKELLASAGFALSHSVKQDLILEFLISKGLHDIFLVNDVLYEFGEPTLGT